MVGGVLVEIDVVVSRQFDDGDDPDESRRSERGDEALPGESSVAVPLRLEGTEENVDGGEYGHPPHHISWHTRRKGVDEEHCEEQCHRHHMKPTGQTYPEIPRTFFAIGEHVTCPPVFFRKFSPLRVGEDCYGARYCEYHRNREEVVRQIREYYPVHGREDASIPPHSSVIHKSHRYFFVSEGSLKERDESREYHQKNCRGKNTITEFHKASISNFQSACP